MRLPAMICVFVLSCFAFGGGDTEIKGHLVLNGGGKKPAVVMEKFIELAGGKDAAIVVIPTASELSDTGEYYRKLFERDYNVFLHFSVAALYFLVISLAIFFIAGLVSKRLNRHIRPDNRSRIRFKPNYIR